MIRFTTLFASSSLLLAGLLSPLPAAAANPADQKIQLVASAQFPGAKGAAKFRDRKGEKELQVEVEVARRLAGSVYTVCVNGAPVGTMTINPLGAGRLSRNSTLGQTVPVVVTGSPVAVKNAAGVMVVSGRF